MLCLALLGSVAFQHLRFIRVIVPTSIPLRDHTSHQYRKVALAPRPSRQELALDPVLAVP
jgi:hypothetical protein